MPVPIRTVQASHAAIAATLAFGEPHLTHPNLVVCGIPDEAALVAEFNRLKALGVPCCEWREEDLGGQATAVATGPLEGAARNPLRGYRLLR